MLAKDNYVAAAMVRRLGGEMGSFYRDQIEKEFTGATRGPHESVTDSALRT